MFRFAGIILVLVGLPIPALGQDLPKMQFNEVKEITPGVFFRYSSISATDPSIPFGGSNHTWIVFEDYVVVVDANFPKEAADVVAAIKKTTDKPIRYVLDTHHHGDHAYGNAVWAKEGATIVAQRNCHRLLTTVGPDQFKKAGEGAGGRKDVAGSFLKAPSLVFDDKVVFDDGNQRVEFLFFGHAHTPGDAVAYLPKHKILCTGDACVNGAFNYMGHADSASWIKVLERMEQLDIAMICPGHGPVAGKDLLGRQKRYFQELRQQVAKGLEAKKTPKEIAAGLDMAWYKEWTGKDARTNADNVDHVFKELSGKIDHNLLGGNFDHLEGESYSRATAGWTPPRRIVVPNLAPARLEELRRLAPAVEFVVARTEQEAVRRSAEADAVTGFASPRVLRAASKARWVHVAGGAMDASLAELAHRQGATLTTSPEEDAWLIWRENVRRFAAGDRLVHVAVSR